MLRLSKKTEYAILAMQYIAAQPNKLASAKEMSVNLNISFEFLSKTLQQLMKRKLIISQQGKTGGYILSKNPENITIAEIISAIDENTHLIECAVADAPDANCGRLDECTIKQPLTMIQSKINKIFFETTLAEFSLS